MVSMTMQKTRRIIEDFAREITRTMTDGPAPAKHVIKFRNEVARGRERKVKFVPLELIRFRKENGRLAMEVYSHEKNVGRINEAKEPGQQVIRKFLSEQDMDKSKDLLSSIKHEGQREPAIITCDGFLINGNRRKMILDKLSEEFPGEDRYKTMKVVILPGEDDEGGPPTLLEIEQIENRYQLQSDGKAEYTGFARALSMRRKIDIGMSLEEQILDDSSYAHLKGKELKRAISKVEADYLRPLECIDRYLSSLDRPELYMTVSEGTGDPEGRWQAFVDYYGSIYKKIEDEKQRLKLGIAEDEVGRIEDVAFKLIRKRQFPDKKVHKVMRELGRWISNPESKKELLKLVNQVEELKPDEKLDENGKELEHRQQDQIWGEKNATAIIRQVKKAEQIYNYKHGQETPLTLLQAALDKLNHDDMDLSVIAILKDTEKAMRLAKDIQTRAHDLEHEIYQHQMKLKKYSEGLSAR